MLQRRLFMLLLLPCIFFLDSCIGIKADITLSKNGSGSVKLEYRVSRLVQSLGALDGNEKWHTIPVGRADFDRTLARLPGLRLASFSETQTGSDIINKAEIEFDKIESLLPFLDAGGKARFSSDQGKNRLSLNLSEGYAERDPDLATLIQEASEGYTVEISFNGFSASSLVLIDGEGKVVENPAGAKIVDSGKKVSLAIGTAELLAVKEGLGILVSW
jgi:hypothetical protein